jgi:glycosyl transferase family 87
VSTRLERWSRPADLPVAALVAALAIGLFAASWGVLHHGLFARHPVKDTPVYQSYGEKIVRGEVPYRDFRLEYPPAALPAFVIPAVGTPAQETYERRFEWMMLACGGALVALMAFALARLGAGPGRLAVALGFAGLAPLALGSVILTRFDLWPAALTIGALAALLSGRVRLGSGVLGLGFAAKLYPILLLPLALAYVWRRQGRREAALCGATFAAVALVLFGPFAAIAPGGLWHSVFEQGTRPLQLESLGSALLIAAHHVFGLGITMSSSHGSQNLAGSLPNAVAVVQSVIQAVAVVSIWIWFGRGEPDRERLVRASALVVAAFIALGKVLSPQFLIWLIPLVPLVRGRRGVAASALLGLAFVLTQTWFPYRYWLFALHFDRAASWTVLVRDIVLVAIVAVLAWPRLAER